MRRLLLLLLLVSITAVAPPGTASANLNYSRAVDADSSSASVPGAARLRLGDCATWLSTGVMAVVCDPKRLAAAARRTGFRPIQYVTASAPQAQVFPGVGVNQVIRARFGFKGYLTVRTPIRPGVLIAMLTRRDGKHVSVLIGRTVKQLPVGTRLGVTSGNSMRVRATYRGKTIPLQTREVIVPPSRDVREAAR